MKKIYFGMTVDDVGIDGWSKVENLRSLLDFFTKEEVPATFFVVPIDEETDKPFYTLSDDYLPIIKDAAAAGFVFAQHGLRHNRFEVGVPPDMILDLPHETENKRYARENADFLKKDHTTENCMKRLKQGRDILEDAFGFKITGYRAPALQESPGMFEALKKSGYEFDSSACLQETGWDYLLDRMDVPRRQITRERYDALRAKGYGLTIPHTCDYTWFLPKEKYAAFMDLAIRDFKECMESGIPFVTCSHVDPVHNGEGLRFLHELYQRAREEADKAGQEIEFLTLPVMNERLNK